MTLTTIFTGFRPELLGFLSSLADNNSREWFHLHRDEFDELWMRPAREFVLAMGERFSELGPDVHAEPKVYGSIFAVTRDTRFSPDKRPYKTHLDLWFWQGSGPGLNRERPGYFFRLTPASLILGAGMHSFSTSSTTAHGLLEHYRAAVLDPARGTRLGDAIAAVGPEFVHGQAYKRVPGGLDPAHPRANLLHHDGLYAEAEHPVPSELFTGDLPDFCLDQFARFKPIQEWLVELLANA